MQINIFFDPNPYGRDQEIHLTGGAGDISLARRLAQANSYIKELEAKLAQQNT